MGLKVNFLLSDTKIRLKYLSSYFKDIGFFLPIIVYFILSVFAALLRKGGGENDVSKIFENPYLLLALLQDGIFDKNIEALFYAVMISLVYFLIAWFYFYKILIVYDLVVSYLLFKLSLLSKKYEKYFVLNNNKPEDIKYKQLTKKIFSFIEPVFDDLLTDDMRDYISIRLKEYKGSVTLNSNPFMPLIVSFIPSKNYSGFFVKLLILIKYIWIFLFYFIFKIIKETIPVLFLIFIIAGFFTVFLQLNINIALLKIGAFLQEIMQNAWILAFLGSALVLYLLKRLLNVKVKTLLLLLFWTLILSLVFFIFSLLSELVYIPFIAYDSGLTRDTFLLILFLPLLYFTPTTKIQYFIYLCYLVFFLTTSSSLDGLGLYLLLILFFSFKDVRSSSLHLLVIGLLMFASWFNPVFWLLKFCYILFLLYTDYSGDLNLSDYYRTAVRGKYSTLILKYVASIKNKPETHKQDLST